MLGELVRDRLLVYRAPGLAVTLEHLRAYPAGFEFRLCVRSRHALVALGVPGLIGIHAVPVVSVPGRQMLLADQQLRVGLAFADGTRVTNLSPLVGVGLGDTPPQPLLVQQGASGIGSRWDQRYWVWGLPPEGPLAVVVAWTGHDVPETQVDLDTGAIRAAAEAAEALWKEEPDSSPALFPPPGFGVAFAPDPAPTGRAPSDEAAARRAVEAAFAGMQELRNDEMVNVEGGERLGPTLRDLHQRFGGTAQTAMHQVERVVFVSDTEAAVWFSVWLGASPYLPAHRGAAVLVDGRWKVSRATFCAL
ncbi:MAG TPA: hypothetical protein VK132_11970, partial [Gemmatimonadales bacterium]|nr:hypothetical protein [Gemmatimonadales bacterium]